MTIYYSGSHILSMSTFTPRGVFYIYLILIMLSLGLKSKQTRSEQKTSPVPSMARRSLSHAYGLAQDQNQSLSNQILREIACFRGFSLYQTCCRGVVGQRTKDVRTYFCYQQKAIRPAAKNIMLHPGSHLFLCLPRLVMDD